jgi:hypothetical protein
MDTFDSFWEMDSDKKLNRPRRWSDDNSSTFFLNPLQQGRWSCDLYIQSYLPLFRHSTTCTLTFGIFFSIIKISRIVNRFVEFHFNVYHNYWEIVFLAHSKSKRGNNSNKRLNGVVFSCQQIEVNTYLKLGILVHYQKRNQLQQGRWPCNLYIQSYLPLFRHST